MGGFDSTWLALREPADARARDPGLTGAAVERVLAHAGDVVRVVDLGAGTGSNLRYLGPRLVRPQVWTLVDDDDELLAEVRPPEGGPRVEVRPHVADLASASAALPLVGTDLVSASALLDLVSAAWVTHLARSCRAADVSVALFALNVDGSITWTPRHPEDGQVARRFARHMRSDKGFGDALGPRAVAAVEEAFRAAGYHVRRAPSPWHLGPGDARLQRWLLEGYAFAATEVDPRASGTIEGWAKWRAARLDAGESELTVGHEDVLATLDRRGDRGE